MTSDRTKRLSSSRRNRPKVPAANRKAAIAEMERAQELAELEPFRTEEDRRGLSTRERVLAVWGSGIDRAKWELENRAKEFDEAAEAAAKGNATPFLEAAALYGFQVFRQSRAACDLAEEWRRAAFDRDPTAVKALNGLRSALFALLPGPITEHPDPQVIGPEYEAELAYCKAVRKALRGTWSTSRKKAKFLKEKFGISRADAEYENALNREPAKWAVLRVARKAKLAQVTVMRAVRQYRKEK